ncbi:hypothetical protein DD549_20330 [Shewanella algae]|uniref:hypothetical protein n=1 Tax=Shewanella algae TaxID=38313 RepID=UPI000D645AB0|nr:hypothetical protein [Shewanella algae]PWF90153.1 hypothetical protein DD549_20330 [Shewanella algae]
MSNNYDLIRGAILNKQQVFADYDGHPREMCPHVIGTKNSREQALFYQFGGSSSSGPIVPNSPQNWRCMPVDRLDNIRIVNGEWHTGDNHSRPQTCVDLIDVEADV